MLSLRTILASIFLVAGLLTAGCNHASKAPSHTGPGIGGTVIYITNATLPDDATIEVRLVELNREGRVDRVVAAETFAKPPTMPLEFWLPYQPGLIVKRLSYGIESQIMGKGRVLFTTTRPIPVLTKGNPDRHVEVVVVPVK